MDVKTNENVAVLLCCYNGEKFIEEQIDSIVRQTYKNISLWVSIDGIDDGSKAIIKKRTKGWENASVHFFKGPGKGFAANFFSLLSNPKINADYYAFSDQDDIWEDNKIERALNYMKAAQKSGPSLYGSRTSFINEHGEDTGLSTLFNTKPNFKNALIQTVAPGNTMVLNRKARDLIVNHIAKDNTIFSHDWLSYLFVSAVGGTVFYDSHASLKYRQHGNNLMGENRSFFSRVRRVYLLVNGTFRKWTDENISALEKIQHLMTEENRKVFDCFKEARSKGLIKRIFWFWKLRIYRQSIVQNIALFLAFSLKRI
jgi:glycosyltransferase involved in cell wall biosynthesis